LPALDAMLHAFRGFRPFTVLPALDAMLHAFRGFRPFTYARLRRMLMQLKKGIQKQAFDTLF
ncbi:hypothetical protein, partial [Eubacterium sp.]|uniref:hypothetical protein n=1 Tax=Eubacterium sp. TaxID=142586 RepID=UPI002FC9748F